MPKAEGAGSEHRDPCKGMVNPRCTESSARSERPRQAMPYANVMKSTRKDVREGINESSCRMSGTNENGPGRVSP